MPGVPRGVARRLREGGVARASASQPSSSACPTCVLSFEPNARSRVWLNGTGPPFFGAPPPFRFVRRWCSLLWACTARSPGSIVAPSWQVVGLG